MAKVILIMEENERSAVAVLNTLNAAHGNNSFDTASTSLPFRQKSGLPEILLLNLKMPRSEGFQVMEWARAQSHLKNTWVIVVSGNDGSKEVQLGFGLGGLLIQSCSDYEIQKMMQWFA